MKIRHLMPLLLSLGIIFASTPMAAAVEKPDMSNITAPVPDGGQPRPVVPMKQTAQCAKSDLTDDIDIDVESPVARAFQIKELHKHATGKGVKVAVIDSGITPNPRLPNIIPGGDYVMGEDGLKDCDHHGTLIAGIIAGQPSEDDSFVGVAPDVELISIRQTSGAFGPENEEDATKASSTLATLASGIVRAVNMGADVINMSVTSCYPAETVVDTNDLKSAINYAYQRGVVLVTAAGNANNETCVPNPGYDPANGSDDRNWTDASVISMPSYYTPAVISVGGVEPNMEPFLTTMAGPWVDIAAPASGIVSLDPDGNGSLANASPDKDGNLVKLTGTSFASAYVSGLVALMLEKEPQLTPHDIEDRLKASARPGPDNIVNIYGAGAVDSLGVLTTAGYASKLPTHTASVTKDNEEISPETIAAIGVGIIILVCIVMMSVLGASRLTRQISEPRSENE